MKELSFVNPKFNEGLNLTVRKGTKWDQVDYGEAVWLTNQSGQIIGDAAITAKYVGPLNDMPETWLHHEHDPACRTVEGLVSVLRNIYGDFNPYRDAVVALMFVRVGGLPDEGAARA